MYPSDMAEAHLTGLLMTHTTRWAAADSRPSPPHQAFGMCYRRSLTRLPRPAKGSQGSHSAQWQSIQQIIQGAPFEVFCQPMRNCARKEGMTAEPVRDYALGRIALVTPRPGNTLISVEMWKGAVG